MDLCFQGERFGKHHREEKGTEWCASEKEAKVYLKARLSQVSNRQRMLALNIASLRSSILMPLLLLKKVVFILLAYWGYKNVFKRKSS